MGTGTKGQFDTRSNLRNLRLEVLEFEADGATVTPTEHTDWLCSSIVQAAAGRYTVTLRDSWSSIWAFSNVDGATDQLSKVTAVNTDTNTFEVQVREASGGILEDPGGATITVLLALGNAYPAQ